jgi:hypothetical protein
VTHSPRLLIGVLVLVVFTVGMGVAGWVFVDGSAPRTVHTADQRAISVGISWPGSLDACVSDPSINVLPNCYREPVDRGSFVKQPWSTYSTFAFCAVGLFILAMADRMAMANESRSRDQTWLGFVALFMGPGSALFHGTLTSWGGWGDQLSMYALLAFIVTCDVTHLRHRPDWFARLFVVSFAAAVLLNGATGALSTVVFILAGIGTGVFALGAWGWWLPAAGYSRSGGRIALAFVVLGVAIVPWVLSNPGVGDPVDIPYHATWHVLAALFVATYAWFLRSEREVPVAPAVADETAVDQLPSSTG